MNAATDADKLESLRCFHTLLERSSSQGVIFVSTPDAVRIPHDALLMTPSWAILCLLLGCPYVPLLTANFVFHGGWWFVQHQADQLSQVRRLPVLCDLLPGHCCIPPPPLFAFPTHKLIGDATTGATVLLSQVLQDQYGIVVSLAQLLDSEQFAGVSSRLLVAVDEDADAIMKAGNMLLVINYHVPVSIEDSMERLKCSRGPSSVAINLISSRYKYTVFAVTV